MSTKVKSSSIDNLTKVTAVSGSLASPQGTLSGYWKLDQTLTGNITGNAATATKWASDVIMNGQTVNGSTTPITIPLNTTTTTNSADAGYITFVKNNSSVNQATYVSAALTYNPNNGALATTGTISASNFSGSSSGTNTGDQTLPTLSSLGGAALSGATFTGNISATNLSGTNTGDQTLPTLSSLGGAALSGATFTGTVTVPTIDAQGAVNSDSGAVQWYIPVFSTNNIFKTYQRASDNTLITQFGSFGAGTGSYSNVFYLDSSGNVTTPGNVTAYSDITLKDNIETIDNALNKVAQTRGVTYTRRDLEDKQTRYTGVIAQEIEAVLPEAVMTDADGVKSVAYGNVIGLLIEAIKELDNKVDSLQKQLDEKNNDTTNN